jgi:hypothetical protein
LIENYYPGKYQRAEKEYCKRVIMNFIKMNDMSAELAKGGGRNTPPKELPREARPFWRRVRSVLARVRNVLEGIAAVGAPLLTGGVGCRGVLGTDLPLSPCDMWYLGAWEALWEDRHDRIGPETRSYPCATRGTSV